PRSGVVSTEWPMSKRRSPSGAFSSSRMRRMRPRPGVRDDASRSFDREGRVNLRDDLLRGIAVLRVVDHALRQDAGADHDPLTGNLAGHALNVGTIGPVDH